MALASCARDADRRPNVLLISLDSVRRDMLGCYGAKFGERSPSPNLDRLASEGVRIEDALSSTSWTLPAHATLFTGQPELVHGVEQDGQRLGDSFPTLAERLRAHGYRTAGVYSGPYLDPRFGLGRGFERYRAGYGPELAAAAETARATLARVHALDGSTSRAHGHAAIEDNARAERALEVASHRDSSSRTVTELVLAELAADDGRPFFLFAHYFDAHFDYVPPPPFDRELDPGYAGSADGRDFVRRLAAPEASKGDTEHLRALHAGELAWIDSEIGRVLDELERRGLAENTLVVVVSDHGDEFLEHGGLGHRRTLYEEVVRVPVLLRWPTGLPAGETRSEPVGLSAVAPSVLALVAGKPEHAALLAPAAGEPVLARLVLSPTGERMKVRVLESFRRGDLKLLRERSLDPSRTETLRWIDLALHPDEPAQGWSTDFTDARAREALQSFRAEHARLARERREPPLAEKAEDLLAAFRGLGYAGEEARVGALTGEVLVLPPT
ncbi:MAG: sulfatase, partial [Planctomycetes bacterium]|nr:sulfatase [Planctomycetota bacterium]